MLFHWNLQSYLPEDKIPIYTNHVAPGTHPALQFHDHNVSELVFVLSGEGEHVIQSNTETTYRSHIKARDILILPPNIIHAYDKTENLEIFNVVYDPHKLAIPILDGYELPFFHHLFPIGKETDVKSIAEPVISLNDAELEQVMTMLKELQLLTTSNIRGAFIASLTAFMRLAVTLGQIHLDDNTTPKKIRYQIGNAIFLLGRNFANGMTLDELAQSVHMSRRTFCRQFRMMTGTSPIQYLKRLKLRHAAELLETTDLDVGSIAQQCGFYDSNFFCKQFQQMYQKTPTSFRKERQNPESVRSAPQRGKTSKCEFFWE